MAARTDKSIMSRNMKKTDAILRDMVTITVGAGRWRCRGPPGPLGPR